MVQIHSRRFPRAATSRSSGGRVDSPLAISRIGCSRLRFLQQTCICLRCPQTTKLCGHHNEALVLRATSAVCPQVRRPFSRLRSSARCSLSVCTCPSIWTHVSASAANRWTCLVTTDQHVHGSVSLKSRGTPAEVHGPNLPRSRCSREGEPIASRSQHLGTPSNDQRQIHRQRPSILGGGGGKQAAQALTGRGVANGRRQGQAIQGETGQAPQVPGICSPGPGAISS